MCHLMKLYTQVTIIRQDTGASGMYQIPALGGVSTLETQTYLHQLASPTFPLSPSLSASPSAKLHLSSA